MTPQEAFDALWSKCAAEADKPTLAVYSNEQWAVLCLVMFLWWCDADGEEAAEIAAIARQWPAAVPGVPPPANAPLVYL